ncbi:MAG: class I adenylate-forming enzyme family protein [Candidatus Obscuribacterales bacterium]|jgi:acyl-CoA synthetase (AMP-forming)/AMP-acid ligase II
MQATSNLQAKLDRILRPGSAQSGYASGGKPALIQVLPGGKLREIDHKALEQLVGKAESLLKSFHVQAGDKVLMTAPNSPELAATILATWRLGAIAVPVDFRLTEGELANVAKSKAISAKVVLVAQALIKDFAALTANLKAENIALCDLGQLHSCEEAVRGPEKVSDFVNLNDPALLILTSGTTGTPKGALHDLASLLNNLTELGEMADFHQDLNVLLPVPISHVLGLEVMLIALLDGSTVIFSEMTIEGIIAANNKFKPEFMVGVPTIYGAFLALPKGTIDLSNAKVLLCGGAPLPLSLAEDFQKVFSRRLNNGYGSTESKIIAVNLVGPDQSVGKLVPSVKVKILNSDGSEQEEGQSGEIVICGNTLMLDYIGQEEATKAAIHDGGYFTGDIGYLKDGYLYISGRAKELIIVAGNKVFPAEVEDVLRANDLVKEVAVIGVPHSKLGQIVKAHTVLEPGEWSDALKADGEEKKEHRQKLIQLMREYCSQHLKRELRPMDWEFYSCDHPLPRTSAGKIDKKQLN